MRDPSLEYLVIRVKAFATGLAAAEHNAHFFAVRPIVSRGAGGPRAGAVPFPQVFVGYLPRQVR